ncbi:MAG: methyltransferase domain-containing protein [Anaerolineales bacterium]|nr:methyltransferase domain-containing protein [Anaerolineales bacterium]
MKIEYEETSKDLQTRIDIHSQYGGRDIDKWMLDVLAPAKGIHILDVGCGSGKQCLAFYEYLGGDVEITGGDVSEELLEKARKATEAKDADITYMDLDFNGRFPFEDETFDLVTCCFAIYYAADIEFTVREMHRLVKPGGRIFTTGPMPENKRLFYDIIFAATQRPIPPMPGSSRYASEILDTIKSKFSHVEVRIFENPLTFPKAEPFLEYTRASLSEDRKLWRGLFQGPDDFEQVMEKITAEAVERAQREGALVMTKVVGGFVATK